MLSSSATLSKHILPATTPTGVGSPLLLGVDDVAKLLNVSARTVWTLTESGELPHLRIGRRVLYPVDALRRWAEARTQGGSVTPQAIT